MMFKKSIYTRTSVDYGTVNRITLTAVFMYMLITGYLRCLAPYPIAVGTNLRTISARLGHANTSTILNVYAHSLRNSDKDAADKLDKIIASRQSINPR